jgi:hypothetical protein
MKGMIFFKTSKNIWVFCFQHFEFPVKINLCCHVYECKYTLRWMSHRCYYWGTLVFCKPEKVQKTGFWELFFIWIVTQVPLWNSLRLCLNFRTQDLKYHTQELLECGIWNVSCTEDLSKNQMKNFQKYFFKKVFLWFLIFFY